MIKLIALDFDWTLVEHKPDKPYISGELMDFVKEFINKGNYAGIISGRPVWGFKCSITDAGFEWAKPFPNFLVARESYLWEYDTNYVDIKELNGEAHNDISSLNLILSKHLNGIINMLKNNNIIVSNFYIYGEFATEIHVSSDKADTALELVKNYVSEHKIPNADVHRNGIMITIYHNKYGKGNTLKRVAQYYGLKPEEVLAVGDNYNDISMIDGKFGFVGGCVGNAVDDIKNTVKKNGGYVGDGFASEGVMDIIRQLQTEGKI